MNRSAAPVYAKTILGFALMLRLTVAAMVIGFYPRNWLFSKAPDLGFLADALSSGRGLSSPFGGNTGPSAFLAPGYPATLAFLFHIFGSYSHAAAAAIISMQTAFGLLTVALVIHVAQQIFGATVANLAGTFWAAAPTLIWLPVILWETSLSALLLTGMVTLMWHGRGQPGRRLSVFYWIAVGAYCGMAMLVNPSLSIVLWALAIFTFVRRQVNYSDALLPASLWLLTVLAVYAPWPLRNAYALHAFIPFRTNFGYELWQGNHAGSNGLFDPGLEPLNNKQEYTDYAARGEVGYMRRKSDLAWSFIRQYPGRFVWLTTTRFARFWAGAGSADNSAAVEFHAVATSLLGWMGFALLYRRHRSVAPLFSLPLLLFPLPYYITHPDFRFRLLLDPLLTILSAYAITRLVAYGQRLRAA